MDFVFLYKPKPLMDVLCVSIIERQKYTPSLARLKKSIWMYREPENAVGQNVVKVFK